MLLRILSESFIKRKRRKAIGILAVALGSSLATALVGVTIEIKDKMAAELKVYGSNILIRSEKGRSSEGASGSSHHYLNEKYLPRLKEMFWANNIVNFTPFLETWAFVKGRSVTIQGTWFSKELRLVGGESWTTGARTLFPYWKIQGQWPKDGELPQALLGVDLARSFNIQVGAKILLKQEDRQLEVDVVGILETGEAFDSEIILSLDSTQRLARLPSKVTHVYVSALTTPESELEKIYHRNLKILPPEEYERWACTPFPSTICFQIQNVIPHSVAEPILEVTEREGALLEKMKGLFYTICGISLVAAALGLTSTLMTTVVERRREVGLLRALGASSCSIVLIFMSELAVIAFVGSILGGLLGYLWGQAISYQIFNTPVHMNPAVIYVVTVVTVVISLVGGILPIRTALRLDPIKVLHES